MLTREVLSHYLTYDSGSGDMTWAVATSNRVKVGDIAGQISNFGYRVVQLLGKRYMAHRLVWCFAYGELPPKELDVDHEDENKLNNHVSNLRLATRSQNMRNVRNRKNNTSGFTGVYWNKACSKWQAYGTRDAGIVYLGLYADLQEAAAVSERFRAQHHGEFVPQITKLR